MLSPLIALFLPAISTLRVVRLSSVLYLCRVLLWGEIYRNTDGKWHSVSAAVQCGSMGGGDVHAENCAWDTENTHPIHLNVHINWGYGCVVCSEDQPALGCLVPSTCNTQNFCSFKLSQFHPTLLCDKCFSRMQLFRPRRFWIQCYVISEPRAFVWIGLRQRVRHSD